jgi:hypothetical protein
MIVPGVFAFPKHQNCIDWIRAFQPKRHVSSIAG